MWYFFVWKICVPIGVCGGWMAVGSGCGGGKLAQIDRCYNQWHQKSHDMVP